MASPAASPADEPLTDERRTDGFREAPALLLAGSEDEDGREPHICRGID